MNKYQKIALLFPGQGAQYPGMVKDFVENFSAARLTFEEGDELLKRKLSDIILNGSENVLSQTNNSQPGIFVASLAIFRVLQELFTIQPYACAGLSLGEYSALTASEMLSFIDCLPLIQQRAQRMNDACISHPGTMAAVIGLNAEAAEKMVKEVNLPRDLWVANFNCPGQVVISGTVKGIEVGSTAAKAYGAKKVIPLQVQGAFHSGLMKQAEDHLAEPIQHAALKEGICKLVMNVPGDFVSDIETIKKNLIKQVTHSVRWEQSIRALDAAGVDLFIEFGPGKTLTGMNKRIEPKAPTINVETIEDLDKLAKELRG